MFEIILHLNEYCSTISYMRKKCDECKIYNRERIELNFEDLSIRNFTTLGRLNYSKAHSPLEIHIHKNTMEICFLARGRQTYTVNNAAYTLSGGDVFITFPDELHSSGGNPEEKSILYWILISFEDTENFLNMDTIEGRKLSVLLKSLKNRKFKGNMDLKTLLDKIITIYYSDSDFKKHLIQSYITEFLINVVKLEKSSEAFISEDIRNAVKYIGIRIKENISLQELSEYTGLSLSRFKQKFKHETGVPPAEFILREKVNLAESLLRYSSKSITEIAYELGFSSGHYFATVFKRLTGHTPTEYKHLN
jgi:AraC-like DNA-binding protein